MGGGAWDRGLVYRDILQRPVPISQCPPSEESLLSPSVQPAPCPGASGRPSPCGGGLACLSPVRPAPLLCPSALPAAYLPLPAPRGCSLRQRGMGVLGLLVGGSEKPGLGSVLQPGWWHLFPHCSAASWFTTGEVSNQEDCRALFQFSLAVPHASVEAGALASPPVTPLPRRPGYVFLCFLQAPRAGGAAFTRVWELTSFLADSILRPPRTPGVPAPGGPSAHSVHRCRPGRRQAELGRRVGTGLSRAQVPGNPMPMKSLLCWPLASLCLKVASVSRRQVCVYV